MIVREIKAADVDALLEIGREMHAESVYSLLKYDKEAVQLLMYELLQNDNSIGFMAIDGLGTLAFFIGSIASPWFSSDIVAEDLLLYVPKKFRGSVAAYEAAREVIRVFEQWARNRGAKMVTLGISTEINADKVARFYSKLDYPQVGTLHRKIL